MKEFELTHPFEEKTKRETLALQLSGMMAVNKKIKAGIYGRSFETACQIEKEASMITYRGLLKGYAEVESQIESLRDSRKVETTLAPALKATGEQRHLIKLYQERDKVAAALLDRHHGLRKDKSHLGKISYERLQDQAERHGLREALTSFRDCKVHDGTALYKDKATQKIQAAQQAYTIMQDKCDLDTGKLAASHYAILKESGVRESEVKAFASVSLEKLQKAFYTLRPERTNKKEVFLKRQTTFNELTSYQRLEAQKISLERSQKLSIEQKQNKVHELSIKQEEIAYTLVTDHKHLTVTQYLLMGLEKESVQSQALKHQVRGLIQSYEKDKAADTLSQIKDLVLDEHQEVKKPVRALLYEKDLYAEIFSLEKQSEREQIHPRDLIELVNERVDILKLAPDLIPEEISSNKPQELRFRKNQSLVVSSKGWKDFMTDEGGRAYGLVQTFGQAASYKDILQTLASYTDPQTQALIESSIGKKKETLSRQEQERFKQESHFLREAHEKAYSAQKAEKTKKVQALYDRSEKIEGTVAETYLKGRGISAQTLDQASDLRFSNQVYNSETKQNSHKALLAFARDKAGEITGVQITYLSVDGRKDTSLENPKKSLGVIKGSAVHLTPYCPGKSLLVAEGIETALSLVEAGANATVVAALGIHNVKILAEEAITEKNQIHERIIVALDNDRDPIDPATMPRHEERLRVELNTLKETHPGSEIMTLQPHTPSTDYNDLLQEKEGLKQIKTDLEKAQIKAEKNIELTRDR